MKKEWNKNSWRKFNIKQQPSYNNSNALKLVEENSEIKCGVIFNPITNEMFYRMNCNNI